MGEKKKCKKMGIGKKLLTWLKKKVKSLNYNQLMLKLCQTKIIISRINKLAHFIIKMDLRESFIRRRKLRDG